MGKKKKKNKKKGKKQVEIPFKYKLVAGIGSVFHLIVFILGDKTFYNEGLFWTSFVAIGFLGGYFLIKEMELLNRDTYKILTGFKLNVMMLVFCLAVILGSSLFIGNVFNGAVLGINYIGKNSLVTQHEYEIEKIARYRSSRRRGKRRPYLRIYIDKDGEIVNFSVPLQRNDINDYQAYKRLEAQLSNGLLGFDILESFELRK